MTSRPVRRAVVAAVVPLAFCSLTACGGSDDSQSASSNAGSSSSTSTAADPAPAAGSTVTTADFIDRYRAAFDSITTAHVTMTLQLMGTTMHGKGDLDYSKNDPAASVTMEGGMFGGGNLEVRLVDNVMYLDLGGMTGNKFAKVDLNDPDNPLGSTFATSIDPSRAMDTLESAVQKVTYVGHDSEGDHYRATVDTQKMVASSGEKVPAGTGLPKTVTYDSWFDDQGRLTKMVVDMGQLSTTTMELSDFGAPVNIQAPPADQVTEMNGMSQMAG